MRIISSVFLMLAFHGALRAQSDSPRNYALLIGISQYGHAVLNGSEPLRYPEDDAKAIKDLLAENGYEVDVATGKNATRSAIQQKLQSLIRKGTSEGVVIVGLFGHGVQIEQEDPRTGKKSVSGYFCPYDAEIQYATDKDKKQLFDEDGKKLTEPDPKSLISMSEVVEALANAKAQTRFLMADCCRDLPNRARGRNLGLGANFSTDKLPTQTVMLFGCKPGEQAFEIDGLGHGVFTKALLEEIPLMLEDGPVTTGTLADRVKRRVQVLTRGKQNPVPISLDSIDLNFHSSALTEKTVLLIPPGQTLSDQEKKLRHQKAVELLRNDEGLDVVSSSYIRGRLHGPSAMRLSIREIEDSKGATGAYEPLVRFIAELQAIDRHKNGELYTTKSEELVRFLSENEGRPDWDLWQDEFRRWKSYFGSAKSFSVFTPFEKVYQTSPLYIRRLLATTTQKHRREFLSLDYDNPTDRAIIASLIGDYVQACAPRENWSHITYAPIAPLLLGDIDSALEIVSSIDTEYRAEFQNGAYALMIDALLDDGHLDEAKKILSQVDLSKPCITCTSDLPLPMFKFHYSGSFHSSAPFAYLAGRLNDEAMFEKITQSVKATSEEDRLYIKSLRRSFLLGLVKDL